MIEIPAPWNILSRLTGALLFGFAVAWVYQRTAAVNGGARSLRATLVLLSILIAMVTQVIGDNVARAFSLVGALSIVRFRTVVRDTRDTAFVIFSVVVGMAMGADSLFVAVMGLAVGGAAAFLTAAPRQAAPMDGDVFLLRLRAALNFDAEPVVAAAAAGYRFLSVANTKQGTAIEYAYEIWLPAGVSPEACLRSLNRIDGIQEVRLTRNGAEEDTK